jgi:hypothetical protein
MRPSAITALVLSLAVSIALAAQNGSPTFDAASIRINTSGGEEGSLGDRPGGYATATFRCAR